jgi:hypothetical protein
MSGVNDRRVCWQSGRGAEGSEGVCADGMSKEGGGSNASKRLRVAG